MSAIVARVGPLLLGLLSAVLGFAALPDLDKLRELLARIQELLAMGGVALALGVSLTFILAWVLSHLRKPKKQAHPVLPTAALLLSYVPVGLTLVAAIGRFFPPLAPFVLKAFALAVLIASFVWAMAVVGLLVGGRRKDLSRARRALLLAGTPWYCLAVFLSTLL